MAAVKPKPQTTTTVYEKLKNKNATELPGTLQISDPIIFRNAASDDFCPDPVSDFSKHLDSDPVPDHDLNKLQVNCLSKVIFADIPSTRLLQERKVNYCMKGFLLYLEIDH
jgi:hypothetical protein